jgi:hypothetical protein
MIILRTIEIAGNMTDTTIFGCRNMIVMHSGCRNAVVAGSAVADYPGMIESCASEFVCIMTNTAILGGGDMRSRFRESAEINVGAIVA